MSVFNLGSINVDHVYRVPPTPGPGETPAADVSGGGRSPTVRRTVGRPLAPGSDRGARTLQAKSANRPGPAAKSAN